MILSGKMPRQARPYKSTGDLRAGLCASSARVARMLRKVWRGVREWSGDAAYERYLRSPQTRSNVSTALSPAQFYVEQLNRRYSRPNRCC